MAKEQEQRPHIGQHDGLGEKNIRDQYEREAVDEVEMKKFKTKEIWGPRNLLQNMMRWKVV